MHSDKNLSKILIVGPDPLEKVSGGVVTHMRNLCALDFFSSAKVFGLPSHNRSGMMFFAKFIDRLFEFHQQSKFFDVIIINSSIYPSSIFKLCALLIFLPRQTQTNRTVLVFFHGGNFFNLGRFRNICINLLRYLAPIVKKFLFLSDAQKDSFSSSIRDWGIDMYRNFSNVDTPIFSVGGDSLINLLFVGRITQDKGVYEISDAFEQLNLVSPKKFKLTFVGDGDALSSLRERMLPRNEDFVEFKGYLSGDALEREYLQADLVLLPSYAEGFPYVFVEAMRAGVPIVSTPVGALKDLVVVGKNGYLVPPRNSAAITQVIQEHFVNRVNQIKMREYCHIFFIHKLSRTSAENFYQNLLCNSEEHC